MSELRGRGPFSVIARIVWLLFGAYIVVTSLVGAVVGVQAFNGWLAILYGALGVTMGLAAILSCFVSGPRRALFVGWSLVGLASRAVLEGNVYLWIVSLPIAAILLTALMVSLVRMPTWSERMSLLAAGIASILALTLLALAAPALPAICPPPPPPGKSVLLISYPPGVFPWETAERKYMDACP